MSREIVEPIIDGAFETGLEHTTQEVIMRVDRHLVLILPEVLDGIDRRGVALKAQNYEHFGEAVRGDFLREW